MSLEDLAGEIAQERKRKGLVTVRPRKPQHRTKESYRWLAQERRVAKVAPDTIRDAMVRIGAPEYAQGVIEAMRHRGPECPLCHAKAMHEWAFRSFERVAKWAGLGEETADVMKAMAMRAYEQVHGLSPEALAEYGLAQLRAYWEPRGKRVVVLDAVEPGGAEAQPTGAAPGGSGVPSATIPGSQTNGHGGKDAQGNEGPRA